MYKILFTLLVACICGFHTANSFSIDANILDKCSKTLGIQKEITSLIFYSKRTSVKLMVFKFLSGKDKDKIKLLKQRIWRLRESFLEADDPPKVVHKVLSNMLMNAADEVPQATWPTLHLTFFISTDYTKASSSVTTPIYNQIQNTLQGLGFKMPQGSLVTLTEERKAFAYWFSTNILLGALRHDSYSVPVLFLGKRSNAFVFAPAKPEGYCERDLLCVHEDPYNFQLYRKTYNFGVEDIKMAVLQPAGKGSTVLTSSCIPPNANFQWTYNNKTYEIRGMGSQAHSTPELMQQKQCNPAFTAENINYLNCMAEVKKAVLKYREQTAGSFAGFNPYIVTTSYDVSKNTQFMKSRDGDTYTMNFDTQSKIVCAADNKDNPFLCFESVYAYVLLHEFYKMADKDTMRFREYIDNNKITWGLSAAYMTRFGVRTDWK